MNPVPTDSSNTPARESQALPTTWAWLSVLVGWAAGTTGFAIGVRTGLLPTSYRIELSELSWGAVPGRFVVAVVAELRVYGFWGCEGRFAELLRILEKRGESVGGEDAGGVGYQICATNLALRGRVVRSIGEEGRIGSRRSSDQRRGCCRICATNLAARRAGSSGGRCSCRISVTNLATKFMKWMDW